MSALLPHPTAWSIVLLFGMAGCGLGLQVEGNSGAAEKPFGDKSIWEDGSVSVPSSAWPSWPSGRQVNVMVSKLKESNTTLTFNNSESRISSLYTVMGAGFSL